MAAEKNHKKEHVNPAEGNVPTADWAIGRGHPSMQWVRI